MISKIHASMTRQVRMCQLNPENEQFLKKTLRKNLSVTAVLAIEIAQETGDPMGTCLATVLKEDKRYDLFPDLYELIPDNSTSLKELRLLITEHFAKTASEINPYDWEIVAETSGAYSIALADLKLRKKALQYAYRSCCLYFRNLPNSSELTLKGLLNLAECLMEVGNMPDAILVQQEAVTGYLVLHQETPEKYSSEYVSSLLVMSSYMMVVENFSEAIKYAEHAALLIESVNNPSVEQSYLRHQIFHNLASCYDSLGQLHKGSELLRKTAEIIWDLSNYSQDRFGPELIETLSTQALLEMHCGNKDLSQLAATQAIEQMEKLYKLREEVFASRYAVLLVNMSTVDVQFGDHIGGLKRLNVAIGILDLLHEMHHGRFSSILAAALNNRVGIFITLMRYDESINDAYKSLFLYRSLEGEDANIAMALGAVANTRMYQGDFFKAQRSAKLSLKIFQRLGDADSLFMPDVIRALGTLASIYNGNDSQAALRYATNALASWDSMSTELSALYANEYHQACKVRIDSLLELERYDEAEESINKAIEHVKQYEQFSVAEHSHMSFIKADLLGRLGRTEQGAALLSEAIENMRCLPLDEVPSYKVDLTDMLINLSAMQASSDVKAALVSVSEAVELYGDLNEPLPYDVSINKALALLNKANFEHELGDFEKAIESIKLACFYQRSLMDLQGFYDSSEVQLDLLVSLQFLANFQHQQNDVDFFCTAQEIQELLAGMDVDDSDELLYQLEMMKAEFSTDLQR